MSSLPNSNKRKQQREINNSLHPVKYANSVNKLYKLQKHEIKVNK